MEIKFESKIDHRLKLIHEKVIGKVTVDEIIKYRAKRINSPGYIDTYNILLDISEGELVDFLKNMGHYIDFIKQISGRINLKRKFAILTSKPFDVAYAELFNVKITELNLGAIIKTFSEEKNALYWLSI